jgi:hypothetical protein
MQHERFRQHKQMRLGGSVRLLVDTAGGLRTASGQIIDLSADGCAIRVHRSVDADLAGRIRLQVAGEASWLPVITRTVQADSRGWTVDCAFDRLTPDKQRVIGALLSERHRLSA